MKEDFSLPECHVFQHRSKQADVIAAKRSARVKSSLALGPLRYGNLPNSSSSSRDTQYTNRRQATAFWYDHWALTCKGYVGRGTVEAARRLNLLFHQYGDERALRVYTKACDSLSAVEVAVLAYSDRTCVTFVFLTPPIQKSLSPHIIVAILTCLSSSPQPQLRI